MDGGVRVVGRPRPKKTLPPEGSTAPESRGIGRAERQRIWSDELVPPVLMFTLATAFAGYEWFRWFLSVPPQPVLVSVVALVAMGYAIHKSLRLRTRMRTLQLAVDGEKTVGQLLGTSRKPGWHVLHDLPGRGFNVDHVLIAPQGVFVIETKTFSKPSRGDATADYDGERLLVGGFKPQRDPIKQACALRDWVRDLLYETTGIRYPVKGVVVLPGWFVQAHRDEGPDDVWVLNPKVLPSFVEHGGF